MWTARHEEPNSCFSHFANVPKNGTQINDTDIVSANIRNIRRGSTA
jgi:hypothetical protein